MKISYILTTIRSPNMAAKTIASIQEMGDHDYEIIITSPNKIKHNQLNHLGKVRICQDNESQNSVQANNKIIPWTNGDWLIFLPDDFKLQNLDIYLFQDFLNSFEMSKKMFKMFSLHSYSAHKINTEYYTPINSPYQIMHFPVIARETIENKLNGVIFNHRFKHHFCDHWLGFYAAQHEEYEPYNYSLYQWPNPAQFINIHSNYQPSNNTFTQQDYITCHYLYNEFLKNKNIQYNY